MKFLKTVEIEYKNLRAASICKAKNDVRFYLTGVYIGDGFIASTNGHIALIVDDENLSGFDLIIPAEAIDSLIKKVGNNPMFKTVKLHQLAEDSDFWLLDHNGSFELFKPIDGKFPDIKKVDIEKPEKVEFKNFPSFDFNYLNLFLKVGKILGLKHSPEIFPTTETNCAYVELTEKAHGLLMPRRI